MFGEMGDLPVKVAEWEPWVFAWAASPAATQAAHVNCVVSCLPFQGTSFSWHSKIGMRSSSTACWRRTWRNSCPLCTRLLWGWPVSTTAWPSAGPGEPPRGQGTGRECLLERNQFFLLPLVIGTQEATSWLGKQPNKEAFDFKPLLRKMTPWAEIWTERVSSKRIAELLHLRINAWCVVQSWPERHFSFFLSLST